MGVFIGDFQLVNQWKPDLDGEKWQYGEERGQPMYIVDQTTKRRYLNESQIVVGF